ncbi:MAG: transglycosylase domain-containing protein [Thermodesulfobacteriota bacterium]
MLRKLAYAILALVAIALTGLAGGYWWLVVATSDQAIAPERINAILALESPVFYRDGVHKVGVFFEEAHRDYVTYSQIPKAFVNALVAAEDHTFFDHHGVDPAAILRAFLANIQAGRVVQGGSTITQQTAKNLFKRSGRTVGVKLREMVVALQLERRYRKEQIFEFYANQFYVSGNRVGLGVAARYFFDKRVEDLDLVECAFIAGSVKSPNTYNPFIKQGEEAIREARLRAKQRAAYVLGHMRDLGMIDAEACQAALAREIPFQRGELPYGVNTIMDRVRRALATPEVEAALTAQGIDNVATAGLRIVSTVDWQLQESAEGTLREELARLDLRLRGYERQEVQAAYQQAAEKTAADVTAGACLFARVTAVDPKAGVITVALPAPAGLTAPPMGQVAGTGLAMAVEAFGKWQAAKASAAVQAQLLGQIRPGDLVYVRVRGAGSDGILALDLLKYPEIQGAALVYQEGRIRAMAGGFDNLFFNRAVAARRPMGSVIKPLVYAAALQLGWSNLDLLDNERNVFIFQGRPYFPRPDHESPHSRVSMTWAGVSSENLATVWLLYHLCDQLSPADFRDLAQRLGLVQAPGESAEAFGARLRDRHGVWAHEAALRQAAYEQAREEVRTDLIFDNGTTELEALASLEYGAGFDDFLAAERAAATEDPDAARDLPVRERLLARSYLKLAALRQELRGYAAGWPLAPADSAGEEPAGTGARLYHEPVADAWLFSTRYPGGNWQPQDREEVAARLAGMTAREQEAFWGRVRIQDELSVATVDALARRLEEVYSRLRQADSRSFEVLSRLRDYRLVVGLQYLVGLCRQLGIESALDPVLSFPLGSNVISLLEAARAYEALVTGSVWSIAGTGMSQELDIIERIETADGEVLYAPDRRARPVLAPGTALRLADILKNVVDWGTGNFAARTVRLDSSDPERAGRLRAANLRYPLLGKTGTANRFTNAAFVGYVPALAAGGQTATLTGGHVLAAYVGFDDNESMVHRGTRISGAAGALPIWSPVASALLASSGVGDQVGLAGLASQGLGRVPLVLPDLGQVEVVVASGSGRPLAVAAGTDAAGPRLVTFLAGTPAGSLTPMREYRPYWQMAELVHP